MRKIYLKYKYEKNTPSEKQKEQQGDNIKQTRIYAVNRKCFITISHFEH